MAAFMHEILN